MKVPDEPMAVRRDERIRERGRHREIEIEQQIANQEVWEPIRGERDREKIGENPVTGVNPHIVTLEKRESEA
jgi:hypothetical protein